MNYESISEFGKVFTIQSVMDQEYKDQLFDILKQGVTVQSEIEDKMTQIFPKSKWVCQVERNKRPYLEVTDKWPS